MLATIDGRPSSLAMLFVTLSVHLCVQPARRVRGSKSCGSICDNFDNNKLFCLWLPVSAVGLYTPPINEYEFHPECYIGLTACINTTRRGAKYCDQRVCMFVCQQAYARISQNHMSKLNEIFCTCYMWFDPVCTFRFLSMTWCFQIMEHHTAATRAAAGADWPGIKFKHIRQGPRCLTVVVCCIADTCTHGGQSYTSIPDCLIATWSRQLSSVRIGEVHGD